MKKMIGLVVILAVLILGGCYVTGLLTERALKQNASLLNNANGISINIKQYQRGWFTSDALLELKFHVPEHEVKEASGQNILISAQDYTLQVPVVLSHGPIIYYEGKWKFGYGYAQSEVNLPKESVEKFARLYTTNSVFPKLKFSIFVNYFNKIQLEVAIPDFKLITKQENEQLAFAGATALVNTAASMQSFDGQVLINGATYKQKDLTATLGVVSGGYAMKRSQWGLYIGTANFAMPSFVIQTGEKARYELDNLDVKTTSDITNGLFSSDLTGSLEKLVVPGKVFGPATIHVAVKNMDAQTLAKINEDLNKLQQEKAVERQKALLIILPQLPKLLGQGAQFAIEKLRIVFPEGEIDGKVSLSLPKEAIGNPFQLLQKIEGHGEIKVPVRLMKAITKAMMRQQLLSLNNTALQQEMLQQLQSNDVDQGSNKQQVIKEQDNQGKSNQPQEVNNIQSSKPLSATEVDEQASTQTDQKLADLVKVGLLSQQGSNFVIVMSLVNGQLTINGQPFSPAMMQF